MRRLLFIGGPLNGRMHPVPDGNDFEAPLEGAPRYVQVRRMDVPVMLEESSLGDRLQVEAAMVAFFRDEAKHSAADDV